MTDSSKLTPAVNAEFCSDSACVLASSVLQQTLKSVKRGLKRAARDWETDDEYVHQLRVSGRRALAALDFFAEFIPESHSAWFRRKIKSVLRSTRRAREFDVLLHEQVRNCGRSAKYLLRLWQSERKDAQASIVALRQKLRKHDRFQEHIRLLISHIKQAAVSRSSNAQNTGTAWSRSRLAEIGSQFLAKMSGPHDSESLHRLRIETKRFRYTVEAVVTVLESAAASELLQTLERLQQQLGSLQDHVTAKAQLQDSLSAVNKSRHRKTLRKRIQNETQLIAEHTTRLRLWLDPAAGQNSAGCLRELLMRPGICSPGEAVSSSEVAS